MKIAQLAQLLDSLAQGLDGVVAAPVVKDLRTFRGILQPFADRSVGDFAVFLAKCEEYQRTGVLAGKKAATPRKSADPQQVENAVTKIQAMLEGINQGVVNNQKIEDLLGEFKQFLKPQLDQLLSALKIAGKANSKDAAIDKVRQMLKNQTEMFVKTHSRQ